MRSASSSRKQLIVGLITSTQLRPAGSLRARPTLTSLVATPHVRPHLRHSDEHCARCQVKVCWQKGFIVTLEQKTHHKYIHNLYEDVT